MFECVLQDLVGGSEGIRERPEGIAFFKVAKSLYPLKTVAYLGLNIPLGTERKRFMHCAYSDTWIKHCASREPVSGSHLGGLALALREPLDWGSLPHTPETDTLLRFANGVESGLRLFSLPLRAIVGELGVFCIGTDMQSDDWKAQKGMLIREFQVLASYFHQHILRIYGHDAAKEMLMSARELDCLKWMAAGKTAWEASVILGITERTVRFHLNAAREKLNCMTTTQAVAKAVSHQLI
jgi:DNA-binding CsgD family transcriptional regulator